MSHLMRRWLSFVLTAVASLSFGCGGDGGPQDDAVCGDGVRAESEVCDDGNLTPDDGCSPACLLDDGFVCAPGGPCRTPCGDGIVAGEEECDDANISSSDGCSASCQIETVVGRFRGLTGADPGSTVTSNEILINVAEGTLVTASTLGRHDERLMVNGEERGPSVRVVGGSQVALRMSAPPGFAQNRTTALMIQDARVDWTVSTRTSTFAWRAEPWSACSNPCGDGFRVRAIRCVDELDRVVDDALCSDDPPASSESCTDFGGCEYSYERWSDWSACDSGLRRRSRQCLREDGEPSDCALCGGDCTGEGPCDVDCSRLGGLVINCSPPTDQTRMACNMALQRSIERCRSQGCAPTVDSSSMCRLGGVPGVPSCLGGEIVCE